MNKKIALSLAIVLGFPLVGVAEDLQAYNKDQEVHARMGEIRDNSDFHKMVDRATDVYAAIARSPQGEVPESVRKNARCIAVIPDVMTGALVVGGSHGNGLASCRETDGSWTQPAAISLNQGSIGLQAGAKSSDLVLFFQNQDSVAALKKGNATFGANLSAIAGKYDTSFDASSAGIVGYTRTEGAFAGASVSGGMISSNQEELTNYYGKKVDYSTLLEGRIAPEESGYAKKLTNLFPNNRI